MVVVDDNPLTLSHRFGKAAVQKALTKLSEDGKIMEKVYGKIKVYNAKQPDSAADPAELDAMDKQLDTLKDRVQAVTKECETLTASTH